MIAQMDQWLAHYAVLTAQKYPHADANRAGTGAAGSRLCLPLLYEFSFASPSFVHIFPYSVQIYYVIRDYIGFGGLTTYRYDSTHEGIITCNFTKGLKH